jgi:hypothetical protein
VEWSQWPPRGKTLSGKKWTDDRGGDRSLARRI